MQLKSLDLGKGVYPQSLSSLEKLADLRSLQDVYIYNRSWVEHYDSEEYDRFDTESGFFVSAFGPMHCPNLQRFSASYYRADVHRVFAAVQDPSFARQLAISCCQMDTGFELAALLRADPAFPSLPLHLRMMNINLDRE